MLKIKLFQIVTTTLIAFPLGFLVEMSPAQGKDYYGAISYSLKSGSHGYSYNYSTREAAETKSDRECEGYSGYGDCKTLIWFRNGCGALATSPTRAYGSGWGADRGIAEANALIGCRKYSHSCKIVRWVCTSR